MIGFFDRQLEKGVVDKKGEIALCSASKKLYKVSLDFSTGSRNRML